MGNTLTVYDDLISLGWDESNNALKPYSRNFYKRYYTPTRCACNSDKKGIQVSIAVYEQSGTSYVSHSMELNLTGELEDGSWIELKNYAHTGSLEEVINKVPRLIRTWESINRK